MISSYITEEMSEAVGSVTGWSVSFPVAASDIRRWAIAAYYPDLPPPLYWDEDHAASTVHGGIVAPPEFNPFAWMVAQPKGTMSGFRSGGTSMEAKLGLAEVPTQHMVNGGIEMDYGLSIRPGDVITSTTRLSGYEEREGRLGLMLLTKSSTIWENQEGGRVKSSTGTIIRY